MNNLGLLGLLVLIGCSGPHRGQVSGRVTLHGEPAAGLSVVFHDQQSGHVFIAPSTDAMGHYRVRYAPSFGGVLPGHYRVTIEWLGLAQVDDDEAAVRTPLSRVPIPRPYTRVETTPLTTAVVPGENVFDVELAHGAGPS
jgi:hypothetical protein